MKNSAKFLKFGGLASIAAALVAHWTNAANGLPIYLLLVGAAFFILAAIPWTHTSGRRGLKAAYLGGVCFAAGGMLGVAASLAIELVLGDSISGDKHLAAAILLPLGGFWIGAIAAGCLGVWWIFRVHRRAALRIASAVR